MIAGQAAVESRTTDPPAVVAVVREAATNRPVAERSTFRAA
jgi:hypothetical protein